VATKEDWSNGRAPIGEDLCDDALGVRIVARSPRAALKPALRSQEEQRAGGRQGRNRPGRKAKCPRLRQEPLLRLDEALGKPIDLPSDGRQSPTPRVFVDDASGAVVLGQRLDRARHDGRIPPDGLGDLRHGAKAVEREEQLVLLARQRQPQRAPLCSVGTGAWIRHPPTLTGERRGAVHPVHDACELRPGWRAQTGYQCS
jgi:hypothetical protein